MTNSTASKELRDKDSGRRSSALDDRDNRDDGDDEALSPATDFSDNTHSDQSTISQHIAGGGKKLKHTIIALKSAMQPMNEVYVDGKRNSNESLASLALSNADGDIEVTKHLTIGHAAQRIFVEDRPLLRSLRVEPGTTWFGFCYMVSNIFPIIAACVGPLSNLNSISALADPWRHDNADKRIIYDSGWVLGLNAVSLFVGCAANLALFLNFSGRINYIYAQFISIIGWYLSFFILLVLVVCAHLMYFNKDGVDYSMSGGYWNAVYTCCLYFISATLLFINFIGYWKGIYPAQFNLTTTQQRLMMQNLALILWLGFGGLIFHYLIQISYPNALFFSVVTVTTIGLGDIVPITAAARAITLPYSLVGVILLGLIVTTITSGVLQSGRETMVLNISEKSRIPMYEKIKKDAENSSTPLDPKISFDIARTISRKAKHKKNVMGLVNSALFYSMFWFIGGMIFYFAESDWSYFESIYFCFMCLITIGYGDLVPQSSAGRCFFIIWALGAIPTMTILIAKLSENYFSLLVNAGDTITAFIFSVGSIRGHYWNYFKRKFLALKNKIVSKFRGEKETSIGEESQLDNLPDLSNIENTDDYNSHGFHLPNLEAVYGTGAIFKDILKNSRKPHSMTTNLKSILALSDDDLYRKNSLSTISIKSESVENKGGDKNADIMETLNELDNENKEDDLDDESRTIPITLKDFKGLLLKTRRLQLLIKEIKRLDNLIVTNPKQHFTYEEWLQLFAIISEKELELIDAPFWLSEQSPMRYPLSEVRYFLYQIMQTIELDIESMIKTMNEY